MGARGVQAVEALDLGAGRVGIAAHQVVGLGLQAIQRRDLALDVGERRLRLLGRDLEVDLGVLIGVGLERLQGLLRLGHVGIDGQGLAGLEPLLPLGELLLGLPQVGLDGDQVLLLGERLVELRQGRREAGGIRVQGQCQPLLELGRELIDLGLRSVPGSG